MTDISMMPQQIEDHLLRELQTQDSDATVSVRKTSLGWLKVQVVTNCFEGKTLAEREEKIDSLLASIELNLGQHPISDYSLLTRQQEAEQPIESIQLPLWSEVLNAPNPNHQASIEKDTPKRPQIVTFYSFKGGVGRSTALGMVAILLANRNRRVVIIDFDLEAPGISIFLRPDVVDENGVENYGVLDYLHQRHLTPDKNTPTIEDCIHQVDLPGRGELFLVPAGEYNENYVHRLADLDRRTWQSFYKRETNPVEQLINDIKKQVDPDVILIDSRPGFNDTGAIALLDLADTGIICFSPTDQSFDGLRWVIQAARKQSDYQGKPDLRFLLTPMPILAEDQLDVWITKAEDWIVEHWGLPEDVSVGELYYKIFYNPSIAALSSLVGAPANLLNDYLPIVDAIDASLPDIKPVVPTAIIGNRGTILNELQFEAARAQDLQAANIPSIFQRTEDFPKFLSNRTWLIRGAKGTGKSILFRLFVEQSDRAKDLALSDVDLTNCQFVAAHGETRLGNSILSSENLASYEQGVGEDSWAIFWLNYALLQLCVSSPDLVSATGLDDELVKLSTENHLTQVSIILWLEKRTRSPQAIAQASDELRSIDRWLNENNKSEWLLYDELDAGFGFGAGSYPRRRRALEALLAWWLESGASLKRIIPKIFLREDIWSQLNFVNKGHYTGKSLRLSWDEADLWRLVLRQALQSSLSLSQALEQEFGVTVDRLETLELGQLRRSLYPLWGERMGRGKKAFTHNWVRTRIADSNENCFPRSLILLLEQAVNKEKSFHIEYSAEITLRPKALIDAFPYVSEQRVEEVRNEYRELEDPLNRLQSERSPIDESRLSDIWNVSDNELSSLIKEIVEAGILKERSRPKDPPPRIYAIAELYLYGLGMVRKGQR
ncbi:MAG: AAA family ATPase [Cyanobacteria bacterium CAN_BIN43]|nr:AAA family ATPase [Cyanobacteria bacterium CAN_BIN43]